MTADALGLDLDRLNQRLFAEAEAAIEGAVIVIDKSDAENPVLKIEYQGKVALLPVNKTC